jgi:hypothetical protein
VYDCFGAGQQVAQVTFGGRDWRQAPETRQQMFDAFAIMRQLHELRWYLTAALTQQPARGMHGVLRRALEAIEAMTRSRAAELTELDVEGHRNDLLQRASERSREPKFGVRRSITAAPT